MTLGAGGVGGLLKIDYDSMGPSIPAKGSYVTCDGNGNVVGTVEASSGQWDSENEYGPFGEVIRGSSPFGSQSLYAQSNPFGFSTKYRDHETGLLYYGMRYYNPATGRWISRDPIEEDGGLNLYGFTGNDPISHWDYLGMICGISVHQADAVGGHAWLEVNGRAWGYSPDPRAPFLDLFTGCSGEVREEFNTQKIERINWETRRLTWQEIEGVLFDRTLQYGQGKGTGADCATCEDFEDCVNEAIDAYRANETYAVFFNDCRDFVNTVLEQCGLRKGQKF